MLPKYHHDIVILDSVKFVYFIVVSTSLVHLDFNIKPTHVYYWMVDVIM